MLPVIFTSFQKRKNKCTFTIVSGKSYDEITGQIYIDMKRLTFLIILAIIIQTDRLKYD